MKADSLLLNTSSPKVLREQSMQATDVSSAGILEMGLNAVTKTTTAIQSIENKYEDWKPLFSRYEKAVELAREITAVSIFRISIPVP
jgi:hypothetical protein